MRAGLARALTVVTLATFGAASASASAIPGPARDPVMAQQARQHYRNPLRLIRHLHAMRIDEGVDYRGSGPIQALGSGTITVVARRSSHFWAHVDGNVVVERIQEGPLAGLSIYQAENCTPNPSLRVGDQVTAGTTLCRLHNRFPYLEIGVARNDTSGIPAAWSVYSRFPDGSKTAYGVDFSHLLGDLGAPEGNTNHRRGDVSYHPRRTVGKLAHGFPRF